MEPAESVRTSHEPNGYFWEGIVELLLMTEAKTPWRVGSRLIQKAALSSPTGQDREALDDLAGRLRGVATDGSRLRKLMDFAESSGFEFDG
jgi:hypothetical protein